MKANKQGKIKVNKSGFNRSRFNWTHDVNSTFTWGEIQPTQCKLLIPNSKTTMRAQSLIRLAPMVAPTFGRVKYKTFSQFVGIPEIFPNWDAMMAQEPKTTDYGTKVPQAVPTAKLSELSAWCLHGARATVYFALATTDGRTSAQNAADGYYVTSYRPDPSSDLDGANVMRTYLGYLYDWECVMDVSDPYDSSSSGLPNVSTRAVLDLSKVYSTAVGTSNFPSVVVPLSLTSYKQLFAVDRSYTPDSHSKPTIPDYMREVTMDSADFVLEGVTRAPTDSEAPLIHYAIALELSDSGKRFRKILQGCGYQLDLISTEYVSILPLLAQYKAYFDVFGLQLYKGWETTYCSKVIKYIENNFIEHPIVKWDGSSVTDSSNYSFIYFILNELFNEWYTEDADWIGSHMEKQAVSPIVDTTGFISVTGTGEVRNGANIVSPGVVDVATKIANTQQPLETTIISGNGANEVHNYISQIQHGQVDAEVLKRMYKWTNRNTVLGREIEKILRAQNLGKYCDETKSNFIGNSDVLVTISDVVAQAATEQAVLGEYGGRGLQYDSSKTLTFENDCYGYWITLATVVPESGYTQGLDPTLLCKSKFEFYAPDWDAIGMEMTRKNAVVATNYICGRTPYHGYQSFGFTPRLSKFKVCQNLVNGDFNRHGKRNVYLPYTLDKQLNVNDYNVDWSLYDQSGSPDPLSGVKINRSGRVSNLPVAGNVWRTPTKYAWLGNFDRIFYNIGEKEDSDVGAYPDSWLVGFDDFNDDNFLGHNVYDVQCYAPMKPIEESYGLEDDEPDHAGAEFVTKA